MKASTGFCSMYLHGHRCGLTAATPVEEMRLHSLWRRYGRTPCGKIRLHSLWRRTPAAAALPVENPYCSCTPCGGEFLLQL